LLLLGQAVAVQLVEHAVDVERTLADLQLDFLHLFLSLLASIRQLRLNLVPLNSNLPGQWL